MKNKFRLLPFSIFTLILLLLNWYVCSGLQVLLPGRFTAPVFWLIMLTVIGSVYLAVSRMRRHGTDRLFKIAAHTGLILLSAELVFALVLIPGDVLRIFTAAPRNFYWVCFAFLLFVLTVLLFLYGMRFGKYNYQVIRHTLYFSDLPENFDGFKLVQISDVHAGSFTRPEAVQRGIDLIRAQQPDLFVFTGDLVNNRAAEIEPWIPLFSQIKAPYGQFSILGNHDYGDYVSWPGPEAKAANLAALKAAHAALGFQLLLDTRVSLKRGGQQLILAGVENWGIGFGERGDLQQALKGTTDEDFKILLSHDPSHWEAQVKTFLPKVQLTLSGHTHGMQFGIEAFGLKWSPVKYRYAHWAGLKSENGRLLHINRGFGFLGFSGRIGIWPEITVLELKKQR